MLAPIVTPPELVTGERLTLEEFLRRWEKLPNLKNAELIEGVVYVPSPVSLVHADHDNRVAWWLRHYIYATPGCQSGSNATWLMLGSAPQPDTFLRIRPSHGGQSGNEKLYGAGAPELAVEVCLTSTEVDFGPKLALYQRAGVREYITIEFFGQRIVWRVLDNGVYLAQQAGADGILRSRVFPGLWLDVAAFWADNGAQMLAVLNAGLASEDHRLFVDRLAGRENPTEPKV
jgi:Uma2 family endonuclease